MTDSTCYFVGMHNKIGMKPLDSKTATGKVIDKIISLLSCQIVKTNLSETDYMPNTEAEIQEAQNTWHEKYNPGKNDVIVLLGNWVELNFQKRDLKVIKISHPAGVYGPTNQVSYINKSVEKITSAIAKNT